MVAVLGVCTNNNNNNNNQCTMLYTYNIPYVKNEINILNYFMIKSLNQWNITFQCQNVNYKSIHSKSLLLLLFQLVSQSFCLSLEWE